MGATSIVTNWQPRDVLRWYDLTPKEQKEFDYMDTEQDRDEGSFFRFKGWTYDLGEFCRIAPRSNVSEHPCTMKVDAGSPLLQWDGYHSDTYFSMTLVKYANDCESVIVGRAFS